MNESKDHGHGCGYCSFCQIKFGSAEARTYQGSKAYHKPCADKLRAGKTPTKESPQTERLEVVPLEDLFYERLQLQLDFENGVEGSMIHKSVH